MLNNLNYGVIGNCRSAALISDKGSIDSCCLPDFDSPSVFAWILDNEKGGSFYTNPEHVNFLISRSPNISEETIATLANSSERFINENKLCQGKDKISFV